MDQPSQVTEERDPLLQIKGLLNREQVSLLTERIQNCIGQLCVCTINHAYLVQQRWIYRLGLQESPLGLFGPSREDDYRISYEQEFHLLIWRADKSPEARPDGKFIIPAERHLRISLNLPTLLHMLYPLQILDRTREVTLNPIEYREGPVRHNLLANEPFGLSEDFPLPPKQEMASVRELAEVLFKHTLEGRTGDEQTEVSFFIGDGDAYPHLRQYKMTHKHVFAVAGAIESLGCTLEPAFRLQAEEAIDVLKRDLKQNILKALASDKTDEARQLREQYEAQFGEKLDSIKLP